MTKKKKKKHKSKDQLPVVNLHLKINYIIDNFNFEKVHRVMVATDWKWQHVDHPSDKTMRVPDIDRMKLTAHHLLMNAATQTERVFATGGFQARRYKGGDLALEFVVCDYDTVDVSW